MNMFVELDMLQRIKTLLEETIPCVHVNVDAIIDDDEESVLEISKTYANYTGADEHFENLVKNEIIEEIVKLGKLNYSKHKSVLWDEYKAVFAPSCRRLYFREEILVPTDSLVNTCVYGTYELFTKSDLLKKKPFRFVNKNDKGETYFVNTTIRDIVEKCLRWDFSKTEKMGYTPPLVFSGIEDIFNTQCTFHDTCAAPIKYFGQIRDCFIDTVHYEDIIEQMNELFMCNTTNYLNMLPVKPNLNAKIEDQCCTFGASKWRLIMNNVSNRHMLYSFMLTPVCMENVIAMYEAGMIMPFDILLCRPHLVSKTADVFAVKDGVINVNISSIMIKTNGAKTRISLEIGVKLNVNADYALQVFKLENNEKNLNSKWIMNQSYLELIDEEKSSSFVTAMLIPYSDLNKTVNCIKLDGFYRQVLQSKVDVLKNRYIL